MNYRIDVTNMRSSCCSVACIAALVLFDHGRLEWPWDAIDVVHDDVVGECRTIYNWRLPHVKTSGVCLDSSGLISSVGPWLFS